MGYQKLFLSASVLGAAIAPDNCLHDANMRVDRLKFQWSKAATIKLTHYRFTGTSHERSAASPGL